MTCPLALPTGARWAAPTPRSPSTSGRTSNAPIARWLATRVEPPLVTQYVETGWARLVYHDAAFQGQKQSYDESVAAAAAARCAAEQGKFWQMHDWLFTNSGERVGAFLPDRLSAMAQAAGLDMPAYDACMAGGEKQAAVRQETSEGGGRRRPPDTDAVHQRPAL